MVQNVDHQLTDVRYCCSLGKNEEGHVLGCIVERDMKGFSTPEIKGKWSLRASITGELIF